MGTQGAGLKSRYNTKEVSPIQTLRDVENQDDWTFKGHQTRLLTHCYHDYPAKMIPQIASKLLDIYGKGVDLIFDPYCGTATTLVEANSRGINAIGTDLNPLAQMVSRAKTSLSNTNDVRKAIEQFKIYCARSTLHLYDVPEVENVRLDFWFKPEVIKKLSFLKHYIETIRNDSVKLFFQTAFSETVRETSNTRSGEFKLYRYPEPFLKTYSPDVIATMLRKLDRNFLGLVEYLSVIEKLARKPIAEICSFNTSEGIPRNVIKPNSVGLVITSPPYGDSHTTVAYGQYSRLSAAWLGFKDSASTDRRLMGGRRIKEIPEFPCGALNQAIGQIASSDSKRAREVASFYCDLLASIQNVAAVVKHGGHACYVVGNRKVKGVVLPTNEAIKCFFEESGFTFEAEYTRGIPNKRMPIKNSPSNVIGALDATMTKEFIVVMKKRNQ